MQTKYVVILGSLLSGLGKGGITSSILKMLDFYGYNALPLKFDGYLNYDCGTMNPFRHGEVFVLDDKSEVDMDFGMYERFLNRNLGGNLSITGGKLFNKIIAKERKGDYLGEDVQIIPHLTNEIIGMIEGVAEKEKPDVLVIEVGGTVGDIENSYFIEAMRQMAAKHDVTFINLTYVVKIDAVGEQKTKPAQNGIRALMQLGIKPDFVICRCEEPLQQKTREKIAMHAGLPLGKVIDDSTQNTVYSLPRHFMEQKLDLMLMERLSLDHKDRMNVDKVDEWSGLVKKISEPKKNVNVAIVGKYMDLRDAYTSVKEALIHAGVANGVKVGITWIESEDLENGGDAKKVLEGMDGVLVPGGFGKRGVEGMMGAIRYARENKIPYLGLCLGMQLMAIEYARNVCGIGNADSAEFDENSKEKVIDIMEEQKKRMGLGGTMRLGTWDMRIAVDTRAYSAYGTDTTSERHRHRYEINNAYKERLEKSGMRISATTMDGSLAEIVEWKDSFGIGTQAHPELKSRLENPAPLFVEFVKQAVEKE